LTLPHGSFSTPTDPHVGPSVQVEPLVQPVAAFVQFGPLVQPNAAVVQTGPPVQLGP
jgi:hypothetical protein